MTNVVSKSDRLRESFLDGNELSVAQIASRFGYSTNSISKAVFRLRMEGYPIYTNKRTNSKGQTTTKYRLGTAPRHVIAAGYAMLSSMGIKALA